MTDYIPRHRAPRRGQIFRLCLVVIVGLLLVPGQAEARKRMSFTPGVSSRASYHVRRGYGSRRHAVRVHAHHRAARRSSRGGGEADGGSTVTPPPGSGFKVIDGVLTYPAPARFQPKNLKPK